MELLKAPSRSVAKLVKTLRRYHTITIQASDKTLTAADPLTDELLGIHGRQPHDTN